MSMETPKISVGMIAEQFSAMSVKSRQWYEKSLREAVLYSLVVYYEARLKSRFVPVLDPWEGMTVANYNYRLVLAEVERKLPMWVSNLPVESENASALYAELLGKAERRRTLRPLGNLINTEEELAKLEADLKYQEGFLQSVLKKLSNEKFVSKAPANVIDMERKKQADAESKIASLKESIAALKK